ncbi:MAG TPA: SDR family NAD(P)-dependent oxidoreductase [Steroidobacteraceae bacterium]|jgi:NAD(P)-dependent dehydrogenase (short-subunit alcohol dehydrogenase family)|nr:SDR family NAD(P)-dependent oxidoreductase [Steroidobacteraceae bacterium]
MKIAEAFTVQDYGVVVTGGASGLGLGFAEGLAENGARVTILDVDAQRVAEETESLRGKGLDVRGEVLDVTDHVALDKAIDSAAAAYGRLDVVFANAGIDSGPGFLGSWVGSARPRRTEGALENYTDERWNRVIDINLNGAFATLRAGARHMKPRKSGRMIVTTSLAALLVEPAIGSAYMAAKAGLAHLARSVALELAAYNITVNSIAPGFFITNIGGGHAKNPEVQRTLARTIPMHRVGFAEDIKGLALFLASPASAYITGQQIVIDGGWGLGAAD